MNDEADEIVVHYGWLDVLSESGGSAWGKLSGKKPWKKRFVVLKNSAHNTELIYLVLFDKDDNWRTAQPKKMLELFPRYKIAKVTSYKGREYVLEVNNENDKWHFSCEKLKNLDLWACQIQMLTKLSRSISGRIFSVSCTVDKDMQRIGAAQQRCLLHFTKWGITLALQDSRSILAMWPLKTIRNYEDSGNCQFTIEAGRRAPMGEGVYKFNTNLSQDREMFNVIDAFVNALLNEQALTSGKKHTTDEEILQTYDQLHKSAIGYNAESKPRLYNPVDTPGYSHLGNMSMKRNAPPKLNRDVSSISIHKPPDYNGLYGADVDFSRVQLDEKKGSPESYDGSPRAYSFSSDKNSYAKLGCGVNKQGASFSPGGGEYDHIHQAQNHTESAYDKIDRSGSSFKARSQGGSWGVVGYPLHGEPSIPCLDGSYKDGMGTSATPDDKKFVFRNSIYSPLGSSVDNEQYPQRRSTNSSQDFNSEISTRHDSTASEGRGFRRKQNGTSYREKSHQDIADHFMYQVPNSLSSQDSFGYTKEGDPIRGGLVDPILTGDVYENSDSVLDETSFTEKSQMSNEENQADGETDDSLYLTPKAAISIAESDDDVYENTESVRNSVNVDEK